MPTVLSIFSGDLWAGAEVMIFNLLAELHKSGRLHLVALSMNEGTLTQRLRSLPIETHVIPESRYTFLQIAIQAIRLFHGQHVHVIHSHRYKENILGFLLSLMLRPRLLVSTIHGLPELPRGERAKSDVLMSLDHALLKRRFANVTAVSQDIRRRLIQEFGLPCEKISVIHNGIRFPDQIPCDPSFSGTSQRDGTPLRSFHIGTVGRLVPVKDFGLFLSTAAAIKRRLSNVRFSILGDGPAQDELTRKSIDLGISKSIEFLSSVSDPFPYYRTLDVYLNTSRHEGIPLSVLEAMACKVPVVAAKVGGIPEIISDGIEGFLVPGREPADFAMACLRLLDDNALRRSVGQLSRKKIETQFSAAFMSSQYLALYTTQS